jgi:hypothetical protein
MTISPDAGARVSTSVEDDPSVNKIRASEGSSSAAADGKPKPKSRPTDDRQNTEASQGGATDGGPDTGATNS